MTGLYTNTWIQLAFVSTCLLFRSSTC